MQTIAAVTSGLSRDVIPIRRAVISVSDKTGIVELAGTLHTTYGVELVSTGGTARAIRGAGIPVKEVSEVTGFPEMLDGRVKTLHPKVHGGIMYVRGNEEHEKAVAAAGIVGIDLVVLNLYAFEATVSSGASFETCVENVDIGGPSMLRSSAKNHAHVAIVTSPKQYGELEAALAANGGGTPYALRKKYAAAAFAHSARYDAAIASWFSREVGDYDDSAIVRAGAKALGLKYGCNPYQLPAALYAPLGSASPFTVRNGAPGYINMLDALNAYQLVAELREACGLPAAASFKHVSPAGAALGVPLSEAEMDAYEARIHADNLTPLATAYIRARQADPLCSFGDFVALSDVVDLATARVLQKEVSDGVIAPGFDADALQVLAAKKGGKFVCVEMDPRYEPSTVEYREVYGVGFAQRRNDRHLSLADLENIVTQTKTIPDDKKRDLLLASIACKYTQSNSVAFAVDGQLVGVGAGQQSRVDCVKLAARKVQTWWLRQAPTVAALPFKDGLKRQDRVNARVRYIEGDLDAMPPHERQAFDAFFANPVLDMPLKDKQAHMQTLEGVCLASDAFFPFRDNIDVAAKFGVHYVAQAGGSVQDATVIQACDQLGIVMAMTGLRLFHH
ncbi:hypothetical protein CTAYLR_009027 [Chrysophaeum taylorii]|uniref:MGS-like domain-containing protein n=1 Tax=Chrysophaeum taylorii TaxID=2483200 RepID=A0AAD7XLU9_9STRA|nr:hypothetical protein CTAYLR_009027 [Chrysophaeum taylorii]